jgi:hypothetical protein
MYLRNSVEERFEGPSRYVDSVLLEQYGTIGIGVVHEEVDPARRPRGLVEGRGPLC